MDKGSAEHLMEKHWGVEWEHTAERVGHDFVVTLTPPIPQTDLPEHEMPKLDPCANQGRSRVSYEAAIRKLATIVEPRRSLTTCPECGRAPEQHQGDSRASHKTACKHSETDGSVEWVCTGNGGARTYRHVLGNDVVLLDEEPQ